MHHPASDVAFRQVQMALVIRVSVRVGMLDCW